MRQNGNLSSTNYDRLFCSKIAKSDAEFVIFLQKRGGKLRGKGKNKLVILFPIGEKHLMQQDEAYIDRRVKTVAEDYDQTTANRCGELMRGGMTVAEALQAALNERDRRQIEATRRFSRLRFNDNPLPPLRPGLRQVLKRFVGNFFKRSAVLNIN